MLEKRLKRNQISSMGRVAALLVSVAHLPFFVPGAIAQDADVAAANDPFSLDIITVTARREDEKAQETPVAVTTRVGEDLGTGRIDDIRDLSNGVPNAMFFNNLGSAISVRGLGYKGVGGLNQEVSTGIFVDDVYVGRGWGVPSFLGDLNHAEIVRGSQSTLYGKNTIGGAVNLVSKDPGDEFGGFVEGTIASNMRYRAQGAVDMPLIEDRLYTRLYLSATRRDGFVDNLTTGDEDNTLQNIGGRFTALGLFDATTAKLTLDYEKLDDDGQNPFAPMDLALRNQNVMDYDNQRDMARGGATLKVEHEFENSKLTSVSAFRAYEWDLDMDGDFTAAPMLLQGQHEEQWQVSQELRLSALSNEAGAAKGDFDWSIGLFAMYEDFKGSQFYDIATVSIADASRNGLDHKASTYSAFATAGYHLSDRLQATAGLRYTREEKSGTVTVSSPSGNFYFGPAMTQKTEVSYQNLSPEFGLNFQATEDFLAYGKVSRGFKAGGISQFVELDGSLSTYDPESAWTFEVGAKTSWFDNRFTLNASAFYTELSDQQVVIFASPFQRVVRNASSSTSMGIELEFAAQLMENLRLHGNYGYVKAEFDEFVDPVIGQDYSGNPLPYAPEHSLGLGVKWDHELTDHINLFVGADYNFRSKHTFVPDADFKQKAQHLVDGRIGVSYKNLTATLWGKNLLDNVYADSYFDFGSVKYGIGTEGRSIGVSLRADW